MSFFITFRGQKVHIELSKCTTCHDIALCVQHDVKQPLALHTLKLLVPKHGAVLLLQHPNKRVYDTGVQPEGRYILLGSYQAELQAVELAQQAEASLRLPDFEHEARRAAARSAGVAPGPTGSHRFGSFKVLPANPLATRNAPPPAAALALLHKLACDPAIIAIMSRHGWEVPLLSEMPPEGLVGVSAVCILGYNRNKGHEISLRLRTDDYAGFRKYLSIRKTLVHELTHNVWSDHDINFKQLNSQLLKEVDEYEAHHNNVRTAGGITSAYSPLNAQEIPKRPAASSHSLAAAAAAAAESAGVPHLMPHQVLPASDLAGAAALARWQQHQRHADMGSHAPSASALAGTSIVAVDVGSAELPDRGSHYFTDKDLGFAAAAPSDGCIQDYEHDDPVTAAAEEAADRLGSLEFPAEASASCGDCSLAEVLTDSQQAAAAIRCSQQPAEKHQDRQHPTEPPGELQGGHQAAGRAVDEGSAGDSIVTPVTN